MKKIAKHQSVFRVAQVQINPTVGDFEGNRRQIEIFYTRAAEGGADLVIFPELVISGYPPEDLVYRRSFFERDRQALSDLCRAISGPPAIIGCLNRIKAKDGDRLLTNSAAIVSGKKITAFYDKICLPNYGVFDERRYFVPGNRCLLLDWLSIKFRVGLSICEDIWVPESPVLKAMKSLRPDLLVNLSASPYHSGKINQRAEIARRAAKQTGCYLAYTNLVGGQDELVFDGRSLFVAPTGRILATAEGFKEDILYRDISLASPRSGQLKIARGAPPVLRVQVNECRGLGRSIRPTLPKRAQLPVLSEIEEIYRALVLSLSDYTKKNGFKTIIVGMSGGIDSAVVGAIAAAVMGPEQCLFVTMPSHITGSETLSDAKALARNLGVRIHEVPIAGMYQTVMRELHPIFGKDNTPGLAEENLQARLRGLILMTLSNKQGHLVVTTGNKSEMATGYCTLYGDMAGGFALIKDVPKMTVYRLAEFINQKAGSKAIPDSIIYRPPTAELRENQKDEDSLPPYPILDAILKRFVEQHQSFSQLAASGEYSEEVLRRVIRLVDRSEYKRRQAPPGTKITPLAFGRDRRMPVTQRFDETA